MPLYTKDSLERLRERIDLIEVLSSHIDLKRAGASYKALCPFHEEKTPSFTVQKGDSHYHCFGCGAHGDAIQFLMNHLKLSFGQAVESLAERFHTPLVIADQREEKGIDKTLLREALEIASHFFHCLLLHTEEGREALWYLLSRGMTLDFITRFEIGLAPQTPGMLRKVMEAKQIWQEVLIAAGLIGKERHHDFFRERITFPIRNAMGSVIGFSARKFKEKTGGGKYINTPETPLFKKSRILFGLNYSREQIAKRRKVIIVEGQVDCLKMIDAGFNYTVASLGTAFGEDHVKELQNLGVKEAVVLFDADEAGEKAAAKVGHLFQKVGIDVLVVTLEAKMDPDSYLVQYGAEEMQAKIAEGFDYLTFLVHSFSKKFPVNTPAGKAELISQVRGQIQEWDDPVMIHESLKKLAALTGVPPEVVGVGEHRSPHAYAQLGPVLNTSPIDPHRILELDLLRWLILVGEEKKEVAQVCLAHLNASHFWTPMCQKIFEVYKSAYAQGKARDLLSIFIELDGEEAERCMEEIIQKKINRERAYPLCVETIQKLLDRSWLQEGAEIKRKIDARGESEIELLELSKKLSDLNAKRPKVQASHLL